jgi:hypothetical protein
MAHVSDDRVLESTTTTGTGALTLAGALTGFKAFGSVLTSPSDTCWYSLWAVDASGNTTGDYEEGFGNYSAANTLTRTSVIRSSNADTLVTLSAGTKYVAIAALASKLVQQDNVGATLLPAVSAEPGTPAFGTMYQYAKSIAGRMLPKIKGPSGLDTAMQTAIFQNRILVYVPYTGATGTGSGSGLGPPWTAGGTVTHPTPSNAAPAMSNQMRRTQYTNVVTTTNQTLGIKAAAADTLNYWIGSAAGLGGFFFASRFVVQLYPAATVRIFSGLTASSATYVVASDTVLVNTCGLWHDTTDPSSGANSFNFVTKNATTATKQSIALSNAIVAGNSYDFYMFCPPNGGTIYWRVDDNVNVITYEGNTATTLPVNTVFMGPQCAMSNGTANITVSTVAISIAGVYTESDR